MRQIVLDTETTGLKATQGHRIIEIGCVEMVNRRITGKHFHQYINPDRAVDKGAFQVHGISDDFLADKPSFTGIADAFLEFVEGAELVIHNAPFDVSFLDMELRRSKRRPGKINKYCQILDTLVLARELHPGQKNNLDALCKRYYVDNKHRQFHGALLDAQILSQVYLAMTGGQTSLFDDEVLPTASITARETIKPRTQARQPTRVIKPNEDECKAHEAYLKAIHSKTVW